MASEDAAPAYDDAYIRQLENANIVLTRANRNLDQKNQALKDKIDELQDLRDLPNEESVGTKTPEYNPPQSLLSQKDLNARNKEGEIADFRQEIINTALVDPSDYKRSLDSLVGLEAVKDEFDRHIIQPLLRPELFKSGTAFGSAKVILLFGPPGCGKSTISTIIKVRALMKEVKDRVGGDVNYFYVKVAVLSSRYRGDVDLLISALFSVARANWPAILFIDEIDALLPDRSVAENEAAQKAVASLLMELEGFESTETDQFLIAATNRPHALECGALRRLKVRILVDVPTQIERQGLIKSFVRDKIRNKSLTEEQIRRIAARTEGFSSDDMLQMCRKASDILISSYSKEELKELTFETVTPLAYGHFEAALRCCQPTVPVVEINLLRAYAEGNKREVEKLAAAMKKKDGTGYKSQVYRPRPMPKPVPKIGHTKASGSETASRSAGETVLLLEPERPQLSFRRMIKEATRVINPMLNSHDQKVEWACDYYEEMQRIGASQLVSHPKKSDFEWYCKIYGLGSLVKLCEEKASIRL